MFQVSPSKELVLTWSGADPNDTDTLYVRAVVKDALTLATLATVPLVDRGSHLFSAGYITPQDPNQMGTGRQIIITITVYTDAGYTIPSQNYSRISTDYLVKKLVDASSFWGSGGSDFDPKELKKLLSEAIKEIKFPEPVKQEFPLKDFVSAIKNELDKLPHELPEAKEADLKPLLSGLEDVRRAINILPTFARPTNLIPLQDEVRKIQSSLTEIVNGIGENLADELKKINESTLKENEKMMNTTIQTILTAVQDSIKDGSFRMSIFGDKNPFDGSDEKKQKFLKSLKTQFKA